MSNRSGRLTFELDDLSVRCLGESFETHFTGKRQTHTAAAQQEANLLAAGILQRQTTGQDSHTVTT